MRTAYRLLLHLYPHDFRVWFAAEMTTAFEARAGECRARGRAVFLRFAIAELIGLLKGAAAEKAARIAADPAVRARSVPDLRMMRPPGITREAYFARVCVNAWRNRG
ncbi:hypothetical protein SBA4_970005 [Candidatus Sulfopaludibacter sp. SbA4]|nr:hypothetical protein SBA4_970005 [Candidatus Sulfopaludibacter sp. SbA4]